MIYTKLERAAGNVGTLRERTPLAIAGRHLPAMWIMTDMPVWYNEHGSPGDWWADMIACVPMENGYQAVVIRPDPLQDTGMPWTVCLRKEIPNPETWGMRGDDDSLQYYHPTTEAEVLEIILELSQIPTGSVG